MPELEIPKALIDENRIGNVVLEKRLLQEHPELMDVLGAIMFVIQMRQMAASGELKFTAYCDKFEPHDSRVLAPRYDFDDEEWLKSGAVIFKKAPNLGIPFKREMPKKVNGS